ncbi:hypothetical protein NPIL_256021, partial [Nephila pilipes]
GERMSRLNDPNGSLLHPLCPPLSMG